MKLNLLIQKVGSVASRVWTSFWNTVRPQLTWTTAAFWAIALTPFFIENASQVNSYFSDDCVSSDEQFGSVYETARHWLRKLDPYLQPPQNVVLVTYSGYEGRYIMGNFCVQREFTAMVLERIARADPVAIAIDWTNNPASCPPDDAGTRQLIESVRQVTKGQAGGPGGRLYPPVPIVAARRTWNKGELESENQKRPTGIDPSRLKDELVGRPDALDGSGAYFAAIRLSHCERDRMPLRWKYYADPSDIGGPAPYLYSLSSEAVRQSNHPTAVKAIEALVDRQDMYVSLFGEGDFTEVHALDLVCSKELALNATFRSCQNDPGKPEELAKLRGKIVLVADVSSADDFHSTPIGSIPGAILHANFIEALIEKAYMKPVNVALQLILSLLLFAVIEYVFARDTHKPFRALGWSLAIICCVVIVAYYFVARLLGYHAVLLLPSLVLIAIRTCYALGERHAAEALGLATQHGSGSTGFEKDLER